MNLMTPSRIPAIPIFVRRAASPAGMQHRILLSAIPALWGCPRGGCMGSSEAWNAEGELRDAFRKSHSD